MAGATSYAGNRTPVTMKGLNGTQITPAAGVFYAVDVPAKSGVHGLVA